MATEDISYAFKPKMFGAPHFFQLSSDGMDWTVGPRSGRISYPMIRHIRLGYKPTNVGSARFIAEIWSQNEPKISISSVSSRSMLDTEDLGKDYAAFLRELHRRVALSKANCVFEAGMPAWRWWPASIFGVLAFLAVGYVVVRGLMTGQYLVAGAITLLGVWFLWQIVNLITRNRPRIYSPDHIPANVLPASGR